MKYCQKCGKEILEEAVVCPNCGCATANEPLKPKEASYDDAAKAAKSAFITNIICVIVLALAVFVWLFVNMFIGAFLCLAAEITALVPNTRIQKAFKQNSLTKKDKAQKKEIKKKLRKEYPGYTVSMVLAIVSLVLLIIAVV